MFANCVLVLYSNWNCSFGSTTGNIPFDVDTTQRATITQYAVKNRAKYFGRFSFHWVAMEESEIQEFRYLKIQSKYLRWNCALLPSNQTVSNLSIVDQFQVPRPWAQRKRLVFFLSIYVSFCFSLARSFSLFSFRIFLLNWYSQRATSSKREKLTDTRGTLWAFVHCLKCLYFDFCSLFNTNPIDGQMCSDFSRADEMWKRLYGDIQWWNRINGKSIAFCGAGGRTQLESFSRHSKWWELFSIMNKARFNICEWTSLLDFIRSFFSLLHFDGIKLKTSQNSKDSVQYKRWR